MILARQETVIRVADGIARSTIHRATIDWRTNGSGRSFEQYLLDQSVQGHVGKLGFRLWLSGFTPEELAAAVQLRLQHILDYRTERFLRVAAGIKRSGLVRLIHWTVEDLGR
jgi:hypothetical protein